MRVDRSAFDRAAELDAADPLAASRAAFDLPEGVIYLDGNSLGPLTHASRDAVAATVSTQWRERLIRSWDEDWLAMPGRVGEAIAPLVGAEPGTVIAADNTSVNLHKALTAAAGMRRGRDEIVVDENNFPTDNYIAAGVARQFGMTLVSTRASQIPAAVGPRTAVVTATHVDYRSAHILHAAEITDAAHSAGALVVWDLAHSAGALEVDLAGLGADFAVGCGYKYLNGGPGAPAFVYAAPRHLGEVSTSLPGWWGHADPFGFEPGFRPDEGMKRFLTGTANILSMVSLEAALGTFDGVAMTDLRAKSVSLSGFLISLADECLVPLGFTVGSPRDPDHRGSHVALGFPGGKDLVARLSAEGIIADFRPPDLVRVGLAPLYNTHREVAAFVDRVAELCA